MNISIKDQSGKDDEVLEALFRHASVRQRAPRDAELKIRQELQAQWEHLTRRRRTRRKAAGLAIAASLVLALLVSTNLFRQPVEVIQDVVVASVEKQLGEVYVTGHGGGASLLATGGQLLAGSELSTTRGARIALAWASGESVRVDQDTRLALISEYEIRLLSGKLYIDSHGASGGEKVLLVQTPSGPVYHIGTRYLTTVTGDQVTISVREGEVSVGAGDKQTIAVQGQKLQLSQDGKHTSTDILTYGEDWRWVELVAPRFNMDGSSVSEFLVWVGRETGREIRYASDAAKLAATQTRMHGNVDMEPLRAMELMLQTSDLKPVINEGVILVSF